MIEFLNIFILPEANGTFFSGDALNLCGPLFDEMIEFAHLHTLRGTHQQFVAE